MHSLAVVVYCISIHTVASDGDYTAVNGEIVQFNEGEVPLIVAALYSHRCMYISTVSAEESSNCEGIGCQLSTGALAAIIIGAAVFLILLCLAIGCLVRQKLKKSKRSM